MEQETLDQINKLTRRPFTEDEVYVFSVVLCDNEIDRDGERFSDKALDELKDRFVGKTGIFDHNAAAVNQNALIFETKIVTDDSRITKNGEAYKYLKASAYMVRTNENLNLITEIDGGIKKEVSISCSTAKRVCSICGCNKNEVICSHIKGKSYNGKECCIILDEITDAYEWSFVAVPAQVGAGVTKHFISSKIKGGANMSEEFTPIETQEDFDNAVKDRLEANTAAITEEVTKRFEGYLSPDEVSKLNEKISENDATIADLTAKNKAYEISSAKMKIALESGIPFELAEKLSGKTEKDIRADAEKMAKYLAKPNASPKFSSESPVKSTEEAAYLSMLKNINDR